MNHITQERHENIHPDNIISDLPLLPLTVVTTVYVHVCMKTMHTCTSHVYKKLVEMADN